jgi:hypothetical protein
MGRDVTGAETGMAMMLEPKKMAVMTGAGAAAGNDDGLEELRQFLQDTTRSGDDPGKDGKKKPL